MKKRDTAAFFDLLIIPQNHPKQKPRIARGLICTERISFNHS